MKLAIFGKSTQKTDIQLITNFFDFVHCKNIELFIHEAYYSFLKDKFLIPEPQIFTKIEEVTHCDYLFCFGGDGTIIDAVHFIGNHHLPILGINVGRLGFLASANLNDLPNITEQLLHNAGIIEERTMLEAITEPDKMEDKVPFALNEITIHKSQTMEMITLHTYVNGEFLNSYWCDGVMISTSTGSTAYSLACGGPIIMPSSGVFVITPIAPHSLTVRPFVIPQNVVVSFEVESRSENVFLALDNRTIEIDSSVSIAVKKAKHSAKFVSLPDSHYFKILRTRLNWGIDSRN